MLVCKGKCRREVVNRRKDSGVISKWCAQCEKFIKIPNLDVTICKCCSGRLRVESHNRKYKIPKVYIDV